MAEVGLMVETLEVATSISTPLALGGFVATLFLFFLKALLKNIDFDVDREGSRHILSKAVGGFFYLAIIVCVLGVLSSMAPGFYKFYMDTYSPPISDERKRELKIVALKKDIMLLRGSHYETINLYPKGSCVAVKEKASLYAKLISEAPDVGVGGAFLVMKYQYAAFGYMMAADVEVSGSLRLALAEKSIIAALASLKELDDLKQKGQGDTDVWSHYEWSIGDNAHNRVRWVLAKAYAIQAYESDKDFNKVASTIAELDESYRTRWNPETELDIKWIVNGRADPKPATRCS